MLAKIGVTIDGHPHIVELDLRPTGPERTVMVDGKPLSVSLPAAEGDDPLEWLVIDGRPYEVVVDPNLHWVRAATGLHQLEVRDVGSAVSRPASGDGRVKAPIPGLISRVLVEPGAKVDAGQTLVVLEAMKMENPIGAARGGLVREVAVKPGQRVSQGELLVEVVGE